MHTRTSRCIGFEIYSAIYMLKYVYMQNIFPEDTAGINLAFPIVLNFLAPLQANCFLGGPQVK